MISDLAKLHAVKPKMPGFAYYGFYGCCSPYNNDWYTQFNASHNSELWLRDDTGAAVSAATGYHGTYVYDLCNPKMLTFYKEVILKRFMESPDVHGVFFVRDDPFGVCLSFAASLTGRALPFRTRWTASWKAATAMSHGKGKAGVSWRHFLDLSRFPPR